MIGIVDYGAGNLFSVYKALDFLGVKAKIVSNTEEFDKFSGIILPGVGAFGYAMQQINNKNFKQPLISWIKQNKPFLGICLGMQLLYESSEEDKNCPGLGSFSGTNVKFTSGKIPLIGWNKVNFNKSNILSKGFEKAEYFYFVHSYYISPKNGDEVLATSDYFVKYPVAIQKGNVFAVQFHPEKSGENGLKLLKNWVELC